VPSRQDNLHSHRYAHHRVVAALAGHDPDPPRPPLQRGAGAVLVGLVVSALTVGATAVYGLLTDHGTVDPRNESVVFLEQGTGARYVYLSSDDRLHPVLNYSSALLLTGATEPRLVHASRKSLAKVPLGDPLGIPDAPDSLPPAPDGLVEKVWTVCSQPSRQAGVPQSLLWVGGRPADGTVLPAPRAGSPAADLRGLLVVDPGGRTFLVHQGRRLLIPAGSLAPVRGQFGWTRPPLPVAAEWINAVPAGPDLRPPVIPARGTPAPALPGLTIGQLLTVGGGWGLVLGDGVTDLTEVQGRLLRADGSFEPREMAAEQYRELPRSRTSPFGAGLPPAVPALLNGPPQVCLSYDGGISIRIGPTLPAGSPVTGVPAAPGEARADLVAVPRGKGALVVATASPGAPAHSGTVSLVTDTGRRYPVAGRDLLPRLGYGGVEPQPVPGHLVALLPRGPSLDPVRARQGGR
jgi:type VII secretion protein EccB